MSVYGKEIKNPSQFWDASSNRGSSSNTIPITVLASGRQSATLYISLIKVPQHGGRIQEVVSLCTNVYPYIWGELCFFSPDAL